MLPGRRAPGPGHDRRRLVSPLVDDEQQIVFLDGGPGFEVDLVGESRVLALATQRIRTLRWFQWIRCTE